DAPLASFPTRRSSDLCRYNPFGHMFVMTREKEYESALIEVWKNLRSRSEAYSVLRANFGFASPERWIEYALRHKFRRVRTTPVRSEEHTSELQSREKL